MFVLFDLDDTLLLTSPREDAFFAAAFAEVLGRSLSTTDWAALGASTDHAILTALGIGPAAIEAIARAHERRWQRALLADPPPPRPGALAALHALRAAGVPHGVATGGFARVARRKLAVLGSDVALLATSESGEDRAALLAYAAAQLPGRDGAYLGDGSWDHEAALACGRRFSPVGNRAGIDGPEDLRLALSMVWP